MSDRIRLSAEEMEEDERQPEQRSEPPEPREERREDEPQTERADGQQPSDAPEDEPADIRRLRERIAEANRQKWEAKREAEAMRQQFAQWQQQQNPNAQNNPEEAAYQRLKAENEAKAFNEACNKTFQAGKDEYPDFDQAVANLSTVGGSQDPARWRAFLDAVSSDPNGHRVYRELARDLDEAARVMAMGPAAMGRRIAELSLRTEGNGNGAARPENPLVSRAPRPIRPISGSAPRAPRRLDEMSMADFIKIRDKDEWERRRG